MFYDHFTSLYAKAPFSETRGFALLEIICSALSTLKKVNFMKRGCCSVGSIHASHVSVLFGLRVR